MKKYELIEHTADIGIKVYSNTLEELFENASFAMFDTITDISRINVSIREDIEVEAENINELLVEWLKELLFRFDVGKILFSKFKIKKQNFNLLTAEVYGEKFNPEKHSLDTEIKAVTYHGLDIKKEDGIWTVQIIFDI